jgi:hypothetical protein
MRLLPAMLQEGLCLLGCEVCGETLANAGGDVDVANLTRQIGKLGRPLVRKREAAGDGCSYARHGFGTSAIWATPGILEAMKPGRMPGHGGTEEVPG